jgi:hypothetical protein
MCDLAEKKFEDAIETSWDSDAFAEAVTIVFHSTPAEVSQLRDIVIDTIYNHFEALKDKTEIDAAVCDIPRLAYALYKRKCEESSPSVAPVKQGVQQPTNHNLRPWIDWLLM